MMEQQFNDRPPFPDRSTWLVIFGCLEIGIGAVLLLFVPLMLGTALLSRAAAAPGPRLDPKMMLRFVGFYLLLAGFFLWVGIGTVQKRRWARTLMLSTSWLWLAVGVLSMVLWFAVVLPGFDSLPGASPGVQGEEFVVKVAQVVLTIVMGVIYLALPAVFVLFFRSPSVRATVERRDPKPRWTDRCPGPVLSMVLTLAYGVVGCLFMIQWNVVPFFGILLRGVPAALVLVFSAALLVWLTYGFYRLRREAWWGTLALTALWTAASILTLLRVPVEEIYRLAGIEEGQLEMMRMTGMGGSGYMLSMTLLSAVTVVAYLIYLWKYFRPESRNTPAPAGG